MEPIPTLARADLEALLLRAAHYALVYRAGPRLPETERAERHRQAHQDAVMLEAWAGALRDRTEVSDAAPEGVETLQAGGSRL